MTNQINKQRIIPSTDAIELTLTLEMTPGFKPFTVLRSLGRQSERLANYYISYASNVRRIRQQLWFNHRCKDLGLVPRGLRFKSPLNTQETIQIVKANWQCRRLIRARINDCHRRLNYYNDKIQQRLDKHKQLLQTTLLGTIQTTADKRADKTAEQHRAKTKQKLTRLQDTKNDKRRKPDANWVRNISSRPLDETETQVILTSFDLFVSFSGITFWSFCCTSWLMFWFFCCMSWQMFWFFHAVQSGSSFIFLVYFPANAFIFLKEWKRWPESEPTHFLADGLMLLLPFLSFVSTLFSFLLITLLPFPKVIKEENNNKKT